LTLSSQRDTFDLGRFVTAQSAVYQQVLAELRAGQKRTHWMWFIFPQLAGLGHSQMAQLYAIGSLDEARAYLAHPVLGARLRECTALVNAAKDSEARSGRTIEQIFGYPDDLKFHSSMTLFARASSGNQAADKKASGDQADNQVFEEALEKYFSGELDQATLALIE
jgi:uncharacterized protein (DUF1810 family)